MKAKYRKGQEVLWRHKGQTYLREIVSCGTKNAKITGAIRGVTISVPVSELSA